MASVADLPPVLVPGVMKVRVGEALLIYELDVLSQNSINNTYEDIKQKITSLDLLINNAGIISGDQKRYHAFGDLKAEEISKSDLIPQSSYKDLLGSASVYVINKMLKEINITI